MLHQVATLSCVPRPMLGCVVWRGCSRIEPRSCILPDADVFLAVSEHSSHGTKCLLVHLAPVEDAGVLETATATTQMLGQTVP